MNMTAVLLAATLLAALQDAPPATTPDATAVKLGNFVVTLIEDVRVPAREPGVLVALEAKKGQVVQQGDVLGHVDDSDAQARKLIADNELKSAEEEAASDATLKAAEATIGVALAEYEGSRKIRARAEQAVSEFELRRLQLTHERSVYQAATAQVEYAVAQLTRGAKAAQLQAVNNEIERRVITAPLTGVVVDKYHNVGEWAQAGEPLFRIVHMDRLRVEGMVKADKFMPEQIEGRPVKIFVTTPDGQEEFQGTIDFVNQVVDPSGEFLIHADFDNPRKPNGQWRVRPGLDAEILILLPQQVTPSARDQR
ncbi:MAG: efflux RND transporter periplasmic adaptor subunit [Pirellulaceae bacterium]